MSEYILVPSSNSGRYALDDSDHGRDITSGMPLDILLNGQWISGRVEYGSALYQIDGYYLTTSDGICGLCVGMKVRKGE